MARLKTLMVSQWLWERLTTEGSELHVRCVTGLPVGAEMVNSFYDGDRGCVCFTYRHESWPDLQESQMIQRFTPKFEEVTGG